MSLILKNLDGFIEALKNHKIKWVSSKIGFNKLNVCKKIFKSKYFAFSKKLKKFHLYKKILTVKLIFFLIFLGQSCVAEHVPNFDIHQSYGTYHHQMHDFKIITHISFLIGDCLKVNFFSKVFNSISSFSFSFRQFIEPDNDFVFMSHSAVNNF